MKTNKEFVCVLIFLIAAGLAAFFFWRTHRSSDEADGKALNDEMFQKYEDGIRKLDEAITQIEMNFASAEVRSAMEPYLFLAAEYRLRQAKTQEERIAVLTRLAKTEESLQEIRFRSREGTGTVEPLLRNMESASIIVGQARAWFLGMPNPDHPAGESAPDEEETEEDEADMEEYGAEEPEVVRETPAPGTVEFALERMKVDYEGKGIRDALTGLDIELPQGQTGMPKQQKSFLPDLKEC